jgi:outer membrane protein OmpA-like peptidoglycan-associated protein
MRTYLKAPGSLSGELRLLAGLVLLVGSAAPVAGQQRRYLAELSAAPAYQSFDEATDLGGTVGGIGRLGIWLPLNFSLEVEGNFASPKTKAGDVGVGVKTFAGSVLYNILLGSSSTFYLKAGVGSTKYGSDCPDDPPAGAPICGSSTAPLGGAGVRVPIAQTLMFRGEALVNRNRSDPPVGDPVNLTNVGVSLGLSLMLGSKPIPDSDGDGILDNRDRCPDTPAGARVDGRGCSSDGDGDGVPDGVDRCANTIRGATVDATGCPKDSDSDNIPDGLDRCPDTPAGVLVDPRGCPRDSDQDKIPDGLDRCSETPRGATVDALGCPGDEDGDGVLDGLDRCPRTAAGATVTATGCVSGQEPGRAAPTAPVKPAPGRPGVPSPKAARPDSARQLPRITPDTLGRPLRRAPVRVPQAVAGFQAGVIPGVAFVARTARLQTSSYVALDSVARLLRAAPDARVEIGAHTDKSAVAAEDLRITTLQAEAVRDYLVVRGVPYQQLVARGYGSTIPLTPDTTPRGRATNRRVEIRPVVVIGP